MTPEQQISDYVGFIDQLNNTTLELVQVETNWQVKVNGLVLFSVPDQTIAQNLVTAFQAAALPAIKQARIDAKTNATALLNSL